MEEINGKLKTLGRYYIKGSGHQQNSFSNKEFEQKNHLKNFFQSQKNGKKMKNTVRDPKVGIRRYIWIQGDSNFTSLGSLKLHKS